MLVMGASAAVLQRAYVGLRNRFVRLQSAFVGLQGGFAALEHICTEILRGELLEVALLQEPEVVGMGEG